MKIPKGMRKGKVAQIASDVGKDWEKALAEAHKILRGDYGDRAELIATALLIIGEKK